jgi:hypothetical protein
VAGSSHTARSHWENCRLRRYQLSSLVPPSQKWCENAFPCRESALNCATCGVVAAFHGFELGVAVWFLVRLFYVLQAAASASESPAGITDVESCLPVSVRAPVLMGTSQTDVSCRELRFAPDAPFVARRRISQESVAYSPCRARPAVAVESF